MKNLRLTFPVKPKTDYTLDIIILLAIVGILSTSLFVKFSGGTSKEESEKAKKYLYSSYSLVNMKQDNLI